MVRRVEAEVVTEPRESSDIPGARVALASVAHSCAVRWHHDLAHQISKIVDEMMFRGYTPIKHAPVKRPSLNPALASRIRTMKLLHPEMSQDEIGAALGCAEGRVSEALAGHDYSPKRKR